jgi:pimeloyl-ACP methyl ester carboxylesterase
VSSPARRALLLHGITSNAEGWWRLTPDLVGLGYEVVAVDLLGHGSRPVVTDYTHAAYAQDVLTHGTGWDLVLGHSLGGAVALVAQDLDPGFARMLVLLDPLLQNTDPENSLKQHLAGVDAKPDADELSADLPRWHRRDCAAKARALRGVDRTTVVRTIMQNASRDHRETVARLTVPTLLVGAYADALVDRSLGSALAGANPHVEFVVVAGSGHGIHRDSYEALWPLLAGFLRSGPKSG